MSCCSTDANGIAWTSTAILLSGGTHSHPPRADGRDGSPRWNYGTQFHRLQDGPRRDDGDPADHGVEQLECVRVSRPDRDAGPRDRRRDGERWAPRGRLRHVDPRRLLVCGLPRRLRKPDERSREIPEWDEGRRRLHSQSRPQVRDLRVDRNDDVQRRHGRKPRPRIPGCRAVRLLGRGLHQGRSLQCGRPGHEGHLRALAGRNHRLRPIDCLERKRQQPYGRTVAWGPLTAGQWRISPDISDDWTSPPGQPPWKEGMIDIFDRNAAHAAATAPGTVNDPDMLEVGNGGMTDTEYRTHFGLWALMSAPLIAGNDVRSMSDATRTILTNPEVIAVDQDPLGFQANLAGDIGNGLQVWYKPIAGSGARAVGLLNRGSASATMTVSWNAIDLAPGIATVRDLWARADRGSFANQYSVSVSAHGMALIRVVGTDSPGSDGFLSDQPWTYMANEQGPVERNSSNGGGGAGDGGTLT